jgi:hypothetical protein
LEPIGGSGAIENGFFEYNFDLGRARRRGGHFVRFSLAAPVSLLGFVQRLFHHRSLDTQAVHFTAGELLRNSCDQEKTADIQSRDHILPPLRLESLRELIAQLRCRLWIGYVAAGNSQQVFDKFTNIKRSHMKDAQMNNQSGWGLTKEDLDEGKTTQRSQVQLELYDLSYATS